MAGLYIHIPFCATRCIYCGFYSTTRLDLRQQYVDAVCREMELRPQASGAAPTVLGGSPSVSAPTVLGDSTAPTVLGGFAAEPVSTVYLGGGTPSQLTIPQLEQLCIYINKVSLDHGDGSPDAPPLYLEGDGGRLDLEVTIEMNPDDVTVPYAEALPRLGINRVSMGAQTFDDQRLRFLRRRHTAAQVRRAVAILRDAGIRNISIDLMYGFPGETLDDWQRDIDAALALDVEHISAYCLMIEEGTPLRQWIMDNGQWIMDEELERRMYYALIDRLTAAGYEHYEISNFARRPDGLSAGQPSPFRSRHNSSYWHDVPYIGLGAAAHSYHPAPTVPDGFAVGSSPAPTVPDGFAVGSAPVRSWNTADLRAYIAAINHGRLPSDREVLDPDTHYNDRIATALRTADGLDLATLTPRHRRYCTEEARRFLSDGLLRLDGDRLVLTRRGLFVSDMVMADLMMV